MAKLSKIILNIEKYQCLSVIDTLLVSIIIISRCQSWLILLYLKNYLKNILNNRVDFNYTYKLFEIFILTLKDKICFETTMVGICR